MNKKLVVCNWYDGGYAVVARSEESLRWIKSQCKDFQLSGYTLGWNYLKRATYMWLLEHLKSKNHIDTINHHLWVAKVHRKDKNAITGYGKPLFLPCMPNILRYEEDEKTVEENLLRNIPKQ